MIDYITGIGLGSGVKKLTAPLGVDQFRITHSSKRYKKRTPMDRQWKRFNFFDKHIVENPQRYVPKLTWIIPRFY